MNFICEIFNQRIQSDSKLKNLEKFQINIIRKNGCWQKKEITGKTLNQIDIYKSLEYFKLIIKK